MYVPSCIICNFKCVKYAVFFWKDKNFSATFKDSRPLFVNLQKQLRSFLQKFVFQDLGPLFKLSDCTPVNEYFIV